MLRYALGLCGLTISLIVGTASAVNAQSKVLSIELNKVEQNGAGCRFDLIIENGLDIAFARVSADFVFFDQQGVILTRAAAHFGRLRPNKSHLRSFVLSPLNCGDVSRVLLNDFTECRAMDGADFDCTDAVRVSHRGGVDLVK